MMGALMKVKAIYQHLIASIILAALLMVPKLQLNIIERLELILFDQLQSLYAPTPVAPDQGVIVVTIDDQSLTTFGQWPWPRTLLADLLLRLKAGGVRAVGLDIIFAESDRLNRTNDEALAFALKKTKSVLAWAHKAQTGQNRADQISVSQHLRLPKEYTSAPADPERFTQIRTLPPLLHNLDALENAASGAGLFYFSPDRDGVVRRVPLIINTEQTLQPSFALELARVSRDDNQVMLQPKGAGIESIRFRNGPAVQVSHAGEIMPRFRHLSSMPIVSAKDVFDNNFDLKMFEGKIVLVGGSAAGLHDQIMTPLGEVVPGVVVHATAVEQLLNGKSLYRPNYLSGLESTVLAVFGILLIISQVIFRYWARLGIFLCLEASLFGVSAFLFKVPGLVLHPIYPALSLAFLFSMMALLASLGVANKHD